MVDSLRREFDKGLSPRVRGNLTAHASRQVEQGSIPRVRGNPMICSSCGSEYTVYPRVCGGTVIGVSCNRWSVGLSPRVRGNHDDVARQHRLRRSIPACAGEPRWWRRGPRCHRVYPRVCGGTSVRDLPMVAGEGLSPRVRGNRVQGSHPPAGPGSIPACAGEPGLRGRCGRPPRVYPRVCGGTGAGRRRLAAEPGLSPRVRGNHALCVLNPACTGSIPACAGNLERLLRRPRAWGSIPACAGEPGVATLYHADARVYPRVCGGTGWMPEEYAAHAGLSPRVRGNRLVVDDEAKQARSIPACAGEPPTNALTGSGIAVYPRVCGGTMMPLITAFAVSGLSPRVRGNPTIRSLRRNG